MNTRRTRRLSVSCGLARVVASVAAMTVATGLSAMAPAGAQVTGAVTFYADINYSGSSFSYTAGSYSNIGSTWNDRASSVRVPAGTVVAVYEHGAFGGRCETFRASDGDLRNNAIGNDTITSLKVGQPCPSRLYDGVDYNGSYMQYGTSIPDLSVYGFSDRARSMSLAPGTFVSVYDLPNYQGLCEVFTADERSFDNNPIRQRASSLRINVGCPDQAVLFEHSDYEGAYFFAEFPTGAFAPLPAEWEDRASSIYLTPGIYIEVVDKWWHTGFLGLERYWAYNCERIVASDPYLGDNWVGNDTINWASMRTGTAPAGRFAIGGYCSV